METVVTTETVVSMVTVTETSTSLAGETETYAVVHTETVTETSISMIEVPDPHTSGSVKTDIATQVLGAVGLGLEAATLLEQELSRAFGDIPWGPFPAMRVGDWTLGMPHPHLPIAPWPPFGPVARFLPLPQPGPVLDMGFLSGAQTVTVAGSKAARCGDMGVCIPACLSFVPFFEIFFGSATVWIEGARAARVLDPSNHCMACDPPTGMLKLGLSVGPGAGNVIIGGVPLPSAVDFAIGKIFDLALGGITRAARAVARRFKLGRFLPPIPGMKRLRLELSEWQQRMRHAADVDIPSHRVDAQSHSTNTHGNPPPLKGPVVEVDVDSFRIKGDQNFVDRVQEQLAKIRSSKASGTWANELANGPHTIRITQPHPKVDEDAWKRFLDADAHYLGDPGSQAKVVPDPNGNFSAIDPHGNPPFRPDGANRFDLEPNTGAGGEVVYDPFTNHGQPPDGTLNHELGHAYNGSRGVGQGHVALPGDPPNHPGWGVRDHVGDPDSGIPPTQPGLDKNVEEQVVVTRYETPYNNEQGHPTRPYYKAKFR